MKRIPINLWDKQHEALKEIAYRENTSMADVMRDALDEHIKKKNKQRRSDKKKK